jgi:CheY-specific phosphatase CheX
VVPRDPEALKFNADKQPVQRRVSGLVGGPVPADEYNHSMGRFKHEEKGKMLTVHMPPTLDQTAADEFQEAAKAWLLSPITTFIFDFTGVLLISQPFYRAMVSIRDILKKAEKKHSSIGISETLLRQIRDDGVEPAFHPVQAGVGVARVKHVDVGFINAFLNATVKTVEIQAQTKVKVGKPYMKKDPLQGVVVASMIKLVSEGFKGGVLLCFPEKPFLKIYGNMFGGEEAILKDDMFEAASELLNIIYGQAKIELNQKGFSFAPALPTILTASAFQNHQTGKVPAMMIPFETDAGFFHLEVNLGNDAKR